MNSLDRKDFTLAVGTSSIGQMNELKALRTLEGLYELGVRSFDTAPLYGNAERYLGVFARQTGVKFQVTTKFGLPRPTALNPSYLRNSVSKSKESLGELEIDTLFIHSLPYSMLDFEILNELKHIEQIGLIQNFGYSGDNEELERFLTNWPIANVMVSFNALDMSNLEILKAHEQSLRIHIKRPIANGVWRKEYIKSFNRSLFKIIGASRGSEIESYFFRFKRMKKYEPAMHTPYLPYFLNFVYSCTFADRIVFGISKINQMRQILNLTSEIRASEILKEVFQERYQRWRQANTFGWKALR